MGSMRCVSIVGVGFVVVACGGDPSSAGSFDDTRGANSAPAAASQGTAIRSPAEILAKGVTGLDEDLVPAAAGAAKLSAVSSVKPSVAHTAKLTAPLSEYVAFPGGRLLHQSCVHSMPNGAHVAENGDVVAARGDVIEHVEACQYDPILQGNTPTGPNRPQPNGNIEDVYGHPVSTPWFDGVASQVTVPPSPTKFQIFGGNDVFLWSGLISQLTSNNIVIQPVLQWGQAGQNCSSGGQNWEMQVYYIDINNVGYCGSQQQVNPGDTITEYSLALSCPDNTGVNCNWLIAYVLNNTTYGNYTNQIPVKLDSAVFQSLEAYNLPDCGYFPNTSGTGFLSYWYQPSPSWNSYNQTTQISVLQFGPSVAAGTNVPTNCPYGVQVGGIATALLGDLSY